MKAFKQTLNVWQGGKYGDDPVCECGNRTHLEGFYPCLIDGTEVEPDSSWVNPLVVCGRCGVVGVVIKGEGV